MKKLSSVTLVFCLACGLLSGCGGSQSSSGDPGTSSPQSSTPASSESAQEPAAAEPVTLRFSWWGGDARHEATLQMIEAYKEKAPHVTVEAEYSGVDGYQQKLFTQLAGGNAPDIMQVDAWWPDAQAKFDAFADLNQFPQLDQSGFDKQFVNDYGVLDSVTYALPTGINAPLMVINMDVLTDAEIENREQWTWEDILEEGPKVNQQNPDRYFFNLEQYSGSYYIQRAYLSQLSGNPTTIDSEFTLGFSREELVTVYSYIKDLYDRKVMQPPQESLTYRDKGEQNPLWINGNAAASMNWTSKLGDLKGNLTNLVVSPIPVMAEGAKNTGMFSRPSQLLTINKKSSSVEESANFLNYFYNDPKALEILKDVRSVPPTTGGREFCNQKSLLDPLIVEATDNALKAPGVVDNMLSSDVTCLDLLYNEYENLAFGKTTPEQSADNLIAGWTERLQAIKAGQ